MILLRFPPVFLFFFRHLAWSTALYRQCSNLSQDVLYNDRLRATSTAFLLGHKSQRKEDSKERELETRKRTLITIIWAQSLRWTGRSWAYRLFSGHRTVGQKDKKVKGKQDPFAGTTFLARRPAKSLYVSWIVSQYLSALHTLLLCLLV